MMSMDGTHDGKSAAARSLRAPQIFQGEPMFNQGDGAATAVNTILGYSEVP